MGLVTKPIILDETGQAINNTLLRIYSKMEGTDTSDATATPSDIVAPKTAYVQGQKVTGNIPLRDANNVTVSGRQVTIPAGRYTQPVQKTVDIDLQSKTATPTTSQQTITPDQGKDGLSSVVINPISPIETENDVTVEDDTVSIPAGYYSSPVTKTVQAGSVGTPFINKGPVTNHAMTLTPQVNRTKGWIPSSSSQAGFPVVVAASDLVSGTKSIAENGTDIDVTNYAKVNVHVPGEVLTDLDSVAFGDDPTVDTYGKTRSEYYEDIADAINAMISRGFKKTKTLTANANGTYSEVGFMYSQVVVSIPVYDGTITTS